MSIEVPHPLLSCLESLLREAFNPEQLVIEDESRQHKVPKGMLSHVRLLIVSSYFEGLSRVARHREVYKLVKKESSLQEVHAWAMELLTPEEYSKKGANGKSPPCQGRGF